MVPTIFAIRRSTQAVYSLVRSSGLNCVIESLSGFWKVGRVHECPPTIMPKILKSYAAVIQKALYLAFIYAYSRIFKRPPAEADMRRHFDVTAPPDGDDLGKSRPHLADARSRPKHPTSGSSGSALNSDDVGIDQAPDFRFTFPQCLLGAFALRHVDARGDNL